MTNLDQKTTFTWPVMMVLCGVVFSAGVLWTKLDTVDVRITDVEKRLVKIEDILISKQCYSERNNQTISYLECGNLCDCIPNDLNGISGICNYIL